MEGKINKYFFLKKAWNISKCILQLEAIFFKIFFDSLLFLCDYAWEIYLTLADIQFSNELYHVVVE